MYVLIQLWLARGNWRLGTGGLFLRQSFRSALFSGPCEPGFLGSTKAWAGPVTKNIVEKEVV